MLAGKGTYGAPHEITYNGIDGRLLVGRYCSIAVGVHVLLGGEHYTDRVTTYPFSMLMAAQLPAAQGIEGRPFTKGDAVVGNDVWIGYGVGILSGVTIGDGAVIGAFSVVTKDVPPYAVMGGNPARLLRLRVEPEAVSRLRRVCWWDWPDHLLNDYMALLLSPNVREFLDRAEADERCWPYFRVVQEEWACRHNRHDERMPPRRRPFPTRLC